jgi:Cytochrome C oxidase, mono-heme subunit/FixO
MFGLHYRLERKAIGLALAIVGVASIGGLVEIAPLFTIHQTVEDVPNMRVYTRLELAGRNIYIREGCCACHSQMIRTLRDEVARYGPYSLAVESKYDHPMLWGSKRTGPDLARVGGKYSDERHVAHLTNPREIRRGEWQDAPPSMLVLVVPCANRGELRARPCNASPLLRSQVLHRSPESHLSGAAKAGKGFMIAMPKRQSALTERGADGLRMACACWDGRGSVRGVGQIAHGMGEHIGRYVGVIEALGSARMNADGLGQC